MSASLRSDLREILLRTGVKAVSLFTGFAIATLAFGMAVGHGFLLTFIIVAAAVRLALGIAIERPSIIRRARRG